MTALTLPVRSTALTLQHARATHCVLALVLFEDGLGHVLQEADDYLLSEDEPTYSAALTLPDRPAALTLPER